MNRKIRKNIIIGTIISFLFIGITLLVFLLNGYLQIFEKLDINKLGHFGDFVGGVLGTFLTLLATILIYLTYYKQSEELVICKNLIFNY